MARPAQYARYPIAEYVAVEEASRDVKHEFRQGVIVAMAGGTPEHAALAAAVIAALAPQLRRGCRAYSSDLRVRIAAEDVVTYPDVSVICGPVERDPDDPMAARNPIVLVEVSSPSTADYDRGEKWEYYQRLPALRAYVLVAHDRPRIDLWERPAPEAPWTHAVAGAGERLRVSALDAALAVDAIYRAAAEDAGA
jgi:Uma2 family endonuclease